MFHIVASFFFKLILHKIAERHFRVLWDNFSVTPRAVLATY